MCYDFYRLLSSTGGDRDRASEEGRRHPHALGDAKTHCRAFAYVHGIAESRNARLETLDLRLKLLVLHL